MKRPAQLAINYIIAAQHSAGGWRYSPGQAGDTSVTGFQVKALVTAREAELNVSNIVLEKASRFLDGVMHPANFGYGYTNSALRPTTTAVGLLCRQLLQKWGPIKKEMSQPVEKILLTYSFASSFRNIYHLDYTAKVLYNYGGSDAAKWNEKVRDMLVKTQHRANGSSYGSWVVAKTETHASNGGTLMKTSMALRILQVYYLRIPARFLDVQGDERAVLRMAVNRP